MRFGFTDTPQALQENVAFLRDIASDCVRFGISVEPDPSGLWGADQMVEWAASISLRCYVVIGGWNPAPTPTDYADWVQTWVSHYGTRVTYCLWNEPNLATQECPNPLPVEQAVELNLAGGRAALKANPNAKVLGSPISPVAGWEEYHTTLYRELEPLVDVALHIYPGGKYENRLDKVRAALELGEPFGPVHVTELDMVAPWVSDDASKPELAAKAYRLCERRKVRSLIYYSIENHRAEAGALKAERRS